MDRPENIEISQLQELSAEFSNLYLNPKHSDLTLVVSGEKIPVHKAILSTRSKYFDELITENPTQTEIALTDINLKTFKILLRYIYTGLLSIDNFKTENLLDLLFYHVKYSLKSLKSSIFSRKLTSLINLDNAVPILNAANNYNLNELIETCQNYLDLHAFEFIRDKSFGNLTEESLVGVLKRNSFAAEEAEICEAVTKWCHNDENKAQNILGLAGFFNNKPRTKLVLNTNIVTHEFGAKAVCGENVDCLLKNVSNNPEPAFHAIKHGLHGIMVELGDISVINNIRLRLDDRNKLLDYKYFIEVSSDNKKWVKVVDYRDFRCRSWQDLYFVRCRVKWIHVVGTASAMSNNEFRLLSLEAYCRPEIVKISHQNSIVYPTWNVASLENNAILWNYSDIGNACLQKNNTEFTSVKLNLSGIRIRFAQPYMVSSLRFLLLDCDDRCYSYYVEASVDDKNWELLVDKRGEKCRSWQIFQFEERPVVFFHIVGTFSSASETLDVVCVECPAVL